MSASLKASRSLIGSTDIDAAQRPAAQRSEVLNSMASHANSSSQPLGVLNEDIITIILQDLSISKQDLCSVCLTSRAFRNIAEPILYSYINWDWSPTTMPPIVLLLRTLLDRPSLGHHLYVIRMTGQCSDFEWQRDRLPSIPTKLLGPHFVLPSVSFADRWRCLLEEGRMDALLALLVYHSPNITHLLLDDIWSKQPEMLCAVLHACTEDQQSAAYRRLTRVLHQWNRSHRLAMQGDYTARLLCFFKLPAIRTLTISLDNPIKMPQPPVCATLQSLDLRDIRESQLKTLLSNLPNLRCLAWKLDYYEDQRHENHTKLIDLDQLMDALLVRLNTLQVLRISIFGNPVDYEPHEMHVKGSVASLRDFTGLRELKIPLLFLDDFHRDQYSFQAVPAKVEKLILEDDLWLQQTWEIYEEDLIPCLEQGLRHKERDHAHLRRIVVAVNNDAKWVDLETVEHLEALARRHTIEVELQRITE